MNGRLRAVDQHGENGVLTQLEALDHDGEQWTKFADPTAFIAMGLALLLAPAT